MTTRGRHPRPVRPQAPLTSLSPAFDRTSPYLDRLHTQHLRVRADDAVRVARPSRAALKSMDGRAIDRANAAVAR
jgi:hypothetical protein